MVGQHEVREFTSRDDARRRLLAAAPVAERRYNLADVSTAVLEGGDGPPVVLLHGPAAYGAFWLPVIPELVKTHRVIVPDLPGHGASVLTNGALDASRMSDWLGELLEQTCQVPAVLVGHGTGGAIAARFAADDDRLVGQLVLVVPAGLAPFEPPPEFGAVLAGYFAQPTEATHDDLWRACVRDLNGLRRQLGESYEAMRRYNVDLARTPANADAVRIVIEQFAVPAIPPETLERISVPTTLIWGRYDDIVRLPIGEAASSRYGWPLHIIDAGNEPAMEAPDAFLHAFYGSMGVL